MQACHEMHATRLAIYLDRWCKPFSSSRLGCICIGLGECFGPAAESTGPPRLQKLQEQLRIHRCRKHLFGMQDAYVEQALRTGLRVTLAMGESKEHSTISKGPLSGQVVIKGRIAHPLDPKQQHGLYWGYQTRLAPSLAAALEDCPFQVQLPHPSLLFPAFSTFIIFQMHLPGFPDAPPPAPRGGGGGGCGWVTLLPTLLLLSFLGSVTLSSIQGAEEFATIDSLLTAHYRAAAWLVAGRAPALQVSHPSPWHSTLQRPHAYCIRQQQ